MSISRSGQVLNAWLVSVGSLMAVTVLVMLLWNPANRPKPGDELVLYCATGMVPPVQEICQEYEKSYGVRIIVESDASGKLLNTKVKVVKDRGDLFLSADATYIDKGRGEGLIAESIPVARIHPVIITAEGNPKKIATARDLLRADVKVALANPDQASIGRVAKLALEPSGEWAELQKQSEQFRAKVSLVGTVHEVAQAVRIGAADAGIVWDATAKLFHLPAIEVPALEQHEERITLGVLTRTQFPQRALHFARYLTARDKGLKQFQSHHFEPVQDADLWADTPTVDLMTGAMLRPAIEETLAEFQHREGVQINWVYNGCGILVAQMKAGKMPSAYFSCDTSFMREVQPDFLPSTNLSENDMVLLVQKGNPHGIARLEDLAKPGVRVGLGHAEKSALGGLTRRLLVQENVYERLSASGNVKVESPTGDYLVSQILVGSLDAVIVYRSNVQANRDNLHQLDIIPIEAVNALATQPFAIHRNSDHKYLMLRLLEAIESPRSQQRFKDLGFRWVASRGKS